MEVMRIMVDRLGMVMALIYSDSDPERIWTMICRLVFSSQRVSCPGEYGRQTMCP